MDAAQFRIDFPAFANTTDYPTSAVNLWMDLAKCSLDEVRWGCWYNIGLELYTAHHLVLAKRDADAVAAGGTAGAVDGITTSKAVDKVSKSMDAASVTLSDAGYWNMTTYGIQFLQRARKIGSGGFQSGAGGTARVYMLPWGI